MTIASSSVAPQLFLLRINSSAFSIVARVVSRISRVSNMDATAVCMALALMSNKMRLATSSTTQDGAIKRGAAVAGQYLTGYLLIPVIEIAYDLTS